LVVSCRICEEEIEIIGRDLESYENIENSNVWHCPTCKDPYITEERKSRKKREETLKWARIRREWEHEERIKREELERAEARRNTGYCNSPHYCDCASCMYEKYR